MAAITAFVEATAGMIFLTTPCTSLYVSPVILNCKARSADFSYIHPICWGSSPSITTPQGFSLGHWITLTYSMQCSGRRGVFAIVQRGYVTWGGYKSRVQSIHALIPGSTIRAWPLKPSVPK